VTVPVTTDTMATMVTMGLMMLTMLTQLLLLLILTIRHLCTIILHLFIIRHLHHCHFLVV
jgi:hypothetical protein